MASNSIKCPFCGETKTLYKPLFSKEQKGLEILESQISLSTGIGTKRLVTVTCHSCGRKQEYEDK